MPFKAVQIKKLQNIVKIAANCGHLLALERNDTQPLSEWTPEQVSSWFTAIGFGDCTGVIKYQKINGEIIN